MSTNSNYFTETVKKHTIHFGKKKFVVNEWLYNYFNKVKDKPQLYENLFKILTGIKKQ